MSGAPTTFVQFGPDPPIDSLPAAFQACLPPNAPSSSCDAIIGSLQEGTGFCSDSHYAQTTFCSCVNNAIPCPMLAAAACANSAFSYVTSRQTPPDGEAYVTCKGQPICVNIVEVGGNQNVVSGITQECGTITNIENTVSANPTLAAITFIICIILIILATARTDSGRELPLPPPPGIIRGPAPPGYYY